MFAVLAVGCVFVGTKFLINSPQSWYAPTSSAVAAVVFFWLASAMDRYAAKRKYQQGGRTVKLAGDPPAEHP
jgi:hypothetical protein